MRILIFLLSVLIAFSGYSLQKGLSDEIFTTGFEPRFTVGGDITGLTALGETINISLNGAPLASVTEDGSFVSTDTVEANQAYLVSIDNPNCTVMNESGIMPYANVTDVAIDCPPETVTVYDIKDGTIPQDSVIALQNMLVTACGSLGYYVQTIETDPDFNGTDYSAVFVFDNSVDCNALQVGDRVDLNPATVGLFSDQIQLQNATYAIQSTGNSLPNPVISTPAALNPMTPSPLNAVLVEVQNVTVTNPDLGFGEFEVDMVLNVDDQLYTPNPAVTLNESMDFIRGPLAYSFGNNKIEPRDASDLGRQSQLIINEVDYDQVDGDENEFAEIYNTGPGIADLTNVELVLVNGSNNTVYNNISLASELTLNPGEYLVIGSPTVVANLPMGVKSIEFGQASNSIQNGSPDGIALVNTMTEDVYDALSYEGSMNGIDIGFANPIDLVEGMATSAADSNSNEGSLSRIPNGVDTNDAETDWEFTTMLTPGAANISDTPPPLAAALVINEVDYDQPGTDDAEFVEIYNPTMATVDLSQYDIVLINGNGSTEYDRVTLSGMLAPGEFAVAGDTGLPVPNGVIYIDGVFSNGIQNGGPDGVALIDNVNNTLVDALSYEGAINAATIAGFANPVDLVDGTATGATDSNSIGGSIVRSPADGSDTGNDSVDFVFSATPSPGAANIQPN